MKISDKETLSIAAAVSDVLEGRSKVQEMDPKKHVSKDKESGKFCVYNSAGKKVKEFESNEDAEKYAIDNHDDLMKEVAEPEAKGEKEFKAKHKIKKSGEKEDGTVVKEVLGFDKDTAKKDDDEDDKKDNDDLEENVRGIFSALESLAKKKEYSKVSKALLALAKPSPTMKDKQIAKGLNSRLTALADKLGKKEAAKLLKIAKLAGTYEEVEEGLSKPSHGWSGEVKKKDEDEVEEGFNKSLVKKASEIALKMGGNMTGAVKKIEKLKKGLSKDKEVKAALQLANEEVSEAVLVAAHEINETKTKMREDKERYQKFFNSALKKFGIKSPAELKGDKKKEFFDYVDKNYEADNESD